MKSKYIISATIILFILVFTIILVLLWSYHAIIFNPYLSIDYTAFGTFGDFFGGFIGTLFAIAGVIFVYYTYENQIVSQKKEQIEGRFFELIKLHKDNVISLKKNADNLFEIYIKNIKNFTLIIKQYNLQYNKNWESKDQVKLSYLFFFYGTKDFTPVMITGINIQLSEIIELRKYINSQGIKYDGSYEIFGIYFRQLFQIVNYIDKKKILTYNEKYEYIKTLRVNLNIEEQYLLFLNSLVSSGLNWEKYIEEKKRNRFMRYIMKRKDMNKCLITKYNLLKNIPSGFKPIDEIDISSEFPNIYFEFMGNKKSRKRKRLEKLYH